ncbi:hypothetical protein BJX63DRAFT_439458 [Aspergillus granulosus]|uniref:Uncharacterized protein n=1 Tax=Aspergillus granulosus TaxID=176169 RepID=A0ABR4GZ04_9EURO
MLCIRLKLTGRHPPRGTIVIVDEAQMSYPDTDFWATIIKDRIYGFGKDTKICLFCFYGCPSTGIDKQPHRFTPAVFNPRQRIKDAIQKITADTQFKERFTLDQSAEDYLFSITNRHPGGVYSLLQYIYYHFRGDLQHRKVATITKDHVVNSLEDEKKVWAFLKFTPLNTPMHQCYINGWLHKAILQVPGDTCEKEIYTLPSRLHEKWAEWILGDPQSHLDPKYNCLQTLCADVLEQFSACSLRHTTDGRSITSAELFRPLEAAYLDEFYRPFTEIARKGATITSEWSRTKDGRVDLWIPEKKWAVEMLREGDRVEDHIRRFHPNGRYYSWIMEGMILEWIIINCTTKLPTRSHPEKNLIHAVFSEKWTHLQIYDNNLALLRDLALNN